MKRLLAIALIAATPVLFLGCGDKIMDGGEGHNWPKPPAYPVRSTPDYALIYMEMAFASRDSVRTDSVYDGSYAGSSIDQTDPNPVALTFTKADEVRIVGALARSSGVVQTYIDLGSPQFWLNTHYLGDPPGWVTIQVPSYEIYVNTGYGEYRVKAPSIGTTQIFEFTLKPTTPDPTSPTDTTWTIVKWLESRAQL